MQHIRQVLLIEDDLQLAELIITYLQSKKWNVIHCPTLSSVKGKLVDHHPYVTLLDVQLPDGEGLTLLPFLKQYKEDMPVIVMSANGEVRTVVKALKMGAIDYLQKPLDLENLYIKISDAVQITNSGPVKQQSRVSSGPFSDSPILHYVWKQAEKIIDAKAPIMIYGETGTGKTLLASEIHRYSQRKSFPFVHINCPSIPENLLESELFGHQRGAFTGADHSSTGKFEYANKGTVFLDEVGDIPLSLQAKLLRVLQDKSFERLGDNKTITVDVRIIAATNCDLEESISKGKFREDLFFRLNVLPLYLPPLRDHPEDISLLANGILKKLSQIYEKNVPEITASAISKLQQHQWPGNIRELENVLERALLYTTSHVIDKDAIHLQVDPSRKIGIQSLKDLEKQQLLDAIARSGGSITKIANFLGVGRDTVYRRLKKFGIDYKKT